MSFEIEGQTRSAADGLMYAFHARYSVVGSRLIWEAKVHHDADNSCLLRGAATVESGQSEDGATGTVYSEVCAAIDLPGHMAAHSTQRLA